MASLVPVADTFRNMRGSFKLGSVDLGTQSSLIKRRSTGKFILLDALTMESTVRQEIDKLTQGGSRIEAILNVHPFHTLHVKWAHKAFPHAKLYGSDRHRKLLPELPWEPELVDTPALHALFADDLEFSVPRGVDFISADESVHFSSVIVLHKDSQTVHVDDTFLFVSSPEVAALLNLELGAVVLHPHLPGALEKRPGAAQDFREWMTSLVESWSVSNLCAAHSGNLLARDNKGAAIAARLKEALVLAEPVLKAHEAKYGLRSSI